MNTTELILLIAGALVFTISFLLPSGKKEKKEEGAEVRIPEEEIKEKIEDEIQEARRKIEDIADETVRYSMEKTERTMEKTSNEKIMAINEFSDTVLAQISKNHKEAVFLYDMLNDKHDKLKNTVSEAMTVEGKLKEELEKSRFAPIKAEKITVLPDFTAEEENRAVMLAATGMPGEDGKKTKTPRKAASSEGGTKAASGKRKTAAGTKKAAQPPEPAEHTEEGQPLENAVSEEKDSALQTGEKTVRQVDVSMAAAGKNGSRNNNEKIRELHKAGKSNMAIAKELGLGIGEVKLVLDLFADT